MFAFLKGEVEENNNNPKIPDITIVVDTHCRFDREVSSWGREWSSNEQNSIWSKGTKRQKGVTILINENFRRNHPSLIFDKPIIDPNGRYIKCYLSILGQPNLL